MPKLKNGLDAPETAAALFQYGALPWRATPNGVEVLLITSRQTRRWIIPKGWPIPGLTAAESAAREAYEEAGAKGLVRQGPIGEYTYQKRLAPGGEAEIRVTVFPLNVTVEPKRWPERGQRDKRWTSPQEAAELVIEPELRDLLRAFAPHP